MTQKICVTGATGFIGNDVCNHLENLGHEVIRISRDEKTGYSAVGNIDGKTNWTSVLMGAECVVHLAARAHILHEQAPDPREAFFKVNVDGTLNLARQAVSAGVKRFVFISSIGVNGEATTNQPFTEQSEVHPESLYALSKREAESGLRKIEKESGLEVVIIRPPLVYGANAPGNFQRLLKLVSLNLPLPFGRLNNQRSFVALDNLTDFIATCINHPAAGGETFLISDGQPVSTTELIRLLSEGMEKKVTLFPLPDSVIRLGARLAGKKKIYQQLYGSLAIDISKAGNLLGWLPPLAFDKALKQAASTFHHAQKDGKS
ncbi:UDP-glucose 4-epimerase family protein [Endozoicomonas atrinae]|uniref:UDP-glucose 4-epimerase family protein n=1 Tax=Endozoicomonas atrinae TaxID=1333660 RepID=UPI003B00A086